MIMNKSEIQFNNIVLDIPRIDEQQYKLLRQVMIAIEDNSNVNNSYYIASSIFGDISFLELTKILKTNIKLCIDYKDKEEWYSSDVISDISIKGDKIFFRPANILHEIIAKSKSKNEHSHLKYILFNGIRYKQTLLFLDYMITQKNAFTIELEEFKLLVENETNYKHFSSFKATVIQRIIADIITKTSYYITLNHKKNKDKTITLEFNYFNKEVSSV